jgi:pyruvate dehydrogenase E1 component alpha subunit
MTDIAEWAGAPGSSGRSGPDDPVQLLTPEGQRREHPAYPCDLDDEAIRACYRDMVLVRRLDGEATALQRQGQLALWAPLLGQEAAQIGSARAMRPQDYAFPTYREHGVAWVRGVDPLEILRLFRGVDFGTWDTATHGMHLYTIVIGNQALHAVGYGMGLQRDGVVGTGEPDRDAACLAYFGDGASSEGDVHEAFVFASVTAAPVVFFCQNNHWAISEPTTRQSRVALYHRAAGYGFPGVQVDGNDVLACYAVTQAALARAREGSGPTLIEAVTYRMGAHTTSDDPSRYRLSSEVQTWALKDPIERVKAYLARTGAADAAFFAEVDAQAADLASRVRAGTLAMPDPDPLTLFEQAYVATPPALVAQRDELAARMRAEASDVR